MIVTEDPSKANDPQATVPSPTISTASVLPDGPPEYDGPGAVAVVPSIASSSKPLPPISKPVNFVNVSRSTGSVKGVWTLDPTIIVPPSFLAPLGPEETEANRPNLVLSTRNGSVDVSVIVLPVSQTALADTKAKRKYLNIRVSSHNGSVKVRLPDHEPTAFNDIRLPMKLNVSSANGSVDVYLPRSFTGPVQLKTGHGEIRNSNGIMPNLNIFSEVDRVQKSFLGDFKHEEWTSDEEWQGDELIAETRNGSVKLHYMDEPSTTTPGFFERLFTF